MPVVQHLVFLYLEKKENFSFINVPLKRLKGEQIFFYFFNLEVALSMKETFGFVLNFFNYILLLFFSFVCLL